MKATVKQGSKRRLKSSREIARDASKATVGGNATRRGARSTKRGGKMIDYPVAETLRWVADGEKLTLHVGGGITWRSDPSAEWDETVAKARGPLSAIGARELA